MFTLEFTYQFPADDDQVSFAMMPPYTYEHLQYDVSIWSQMAKVTKHM